MSNLINAVRSAEFNKVYTHWQPSHFIKHPSEMYNTLYFNNNIDFRCCAKNACSTFKFVWFVLAGREDREIRRRVSAGLKIRRTEYYNQLDLDNIDPRSYQFQFRKNSTRVAVKRDPIERIVSAVNYMYKQFHIYDDMNIKWNVFPKPSLEEFLDTINSVEWMDDTHFFPQHYYMGVPEDYDIVLSMSEVDSYVDFLIENRDPYKNINLKWFDGGVKKNRSSNINFTIDDLPKSLYDRIYHMYKTDYKLGWC